MDRHRPVAAGFTGLQGETPGESVLLAAAARCEMDNGGPAERVAALAVRAVGCPQTMHVHDPNSPWLP